MTMITRVVLLLLGLASARGQDSYDSIGVGISGLSADLIEVENLISAAKDRLAARRLDVIDMLDDLKRVEGQKCAPFWQFQCGFLQPKCIAHYLVCDGVEDCPGGQDEKHCEIPFPSESHWMATQENIPFYTCLASRVKATKAHTTLEVIQDDIMPSMPQIKNANLEEYTDDSTFYWLDSGFYSFANRRFVYWGPVWQGFCTGWRSRKEDNKMIIICTNDRDMADHSNACCRYNYSSCDCDQANA